MLAFSKRLIILARVKNHWAKAPFISNSRLLKSYPGDKKVKKAVCVCVCVGRYVCVVGKKVCGVVYVW